MDPRISQNPVVLHLRTLPTWSALKVAAVSVAWIIFAGVSMIATSIVWKSVRAALREASASAGQGVESVGLSTSLMGFVVFAPPLVLIVAWLMKRPPTTPSIQ